MHSENLGRFQAGFDQTGKAWITLRFQCSSSAGFRVALLRIFVLRSGPPFPVFGRRQRGLAPLGLLGIGSVHFRWSTQEYAVGSEFNSHCSLRGHFSELVLANLRPSIVHMHRRTKSMSSCAEVVKRNLPPGPLSDLPRLRHANGAPPKT